MTEHLINKYNSLIKEFNDYCWKHAILSEDTYDDVCRAKVEDIREFERMCNVFFHINISEEANGK